MTDMLNKRGDFPGVARPSEQAYWQSICIDPNLLVHVNNLGFTQGQERTPAS